MKFFVYWVFERSNPRRGYVGGAYGTGDVRPNQHIKGTCKCAPGCTTLHRPLEWEFLAHCETWEETTKMEMACEREMRLAGYEVINHVFSLSEEALKKALTKSLITNAAGGWQNCKKAADASVKARASGGYQNLVKARAKARATMAAGGWQHLKKVGPKGHATQAAAGWQSLKKANEARRCAKLLRTLKNGIVEVSLVGGKSLATVQAATVTP